MSLNQVLTASSCHQHEAKNQKLASVQLSHACLLACRPATSPGKLQAAPRRQKSALKAPKPPSSILLHATSGFQSTSPQVSYPADLMPTTYTALYQPAPPHDPFAIPSRSATPTPPPAKHPPPPPPRVMMKQSQQQAAKLQAKAPLQSSGASLPATMTMTTAPMLRDSEPGVFAATHSLVQHAQESSHGPLKATTTSKQAALLTSQAPSQQSTQQQKPSYSTTPAVPGAAATTAHHPIPHDVTQESTTAEQSGLQAQLLARKQRLKAQQTVEKNGDTLGKVAAARETSARHTQPSSAASPMPGSSQILQHANIKQLDITRHDYDALTGLTSGTQSCPAHQMPFQRPEGVGQNVSGPDGSFPAQGYSQDASQSPALGPPMPAPTPPPPPPAASRQLRARPSLHEPLRLRHMSPQSLPPQAAQPHSPQPVRYSHTGHSTTAAAASAASHSQYNTEATMQPSVPLEELGDWELTGDAITWGSASGPQGNRPAAAGLKQAVRSPGTSASQPAVPMSTFHVGETMPRPQMQKQAQVSSVQNGFRAPETPTPPAEPSGRSLMQQDSTAGPLPGGSTMIPSRVPAMPTLQRPPVQQAPQTPPPPARKAAAIPKAPPPTLKGGRVDNEAARKHERSTSSTSSSSASTTSRPI